MISLDPKYIIYYVIMDHRKAILFILFTLGFQHKCIPIDSPFIQVKGWYIYTIHTVVHVIQKIGYSYIKTSQTHSLIDFGKWYLIFDFVIKLDANKKFQLLHLIREQVMICWKRKFLLYSNNECFLKFLEMVAKISEVLTCFASVSKERNLRSGKMGQPAQNFSSNKKRMPHTPSYMFVTIYKNIWRMLTKGYFYSKEQEKWKTFYFCRIKKDHLFGICVKVGQ